MLGAQVGVEGSHAFLELTNAYDILVDPDRRAEYDEALAHPGDQIWNYVVQQINEFIRKNPWSEQVWL